MRKKTALYFMKMKYKIIFKQLTLSLWVRTVFLLGFFVVVGLIIFWGGGGMGVGGMKNQHKHTLQK